MGFTDCYFTINQQLLDGQAQKLYAAAEWVCEK